MPNPPDTQNDLATLTAARICHDLLNPIGAIQNGMELLDLDNTPKSEEMQLIETSAQAAIARLWFFRIAFGQAQAGQVIEAEELRHNIFCAFNKRRIQLDWHISGPQSARHIKLVFLLLMCFETALPLGGRIKVEKSGDIWEVNGRGEDSRFGLEEGDGMWKCLKQNTPLGNLNPAEVQFHMVQQFLHDNDVACNWIFGMAGARLIFETDFD